MFAALLYLLAGSAISYFMQKQIASAAEQFSDNKVVQTILKIAMDALLSITWIITMPAYWFVKFSKRFDIPKK